MLCWCWMNVDYVALHGGDICFNVPFAMTRFQPRNSSLTIGKISSLIKTSGLNERPGPFQHDVFSILWYLGVLLSSQISLLWHVVHWKKWPCFCEALRLEMQVKRFELFREDIACRHNAVAFVSFCRVCEGGQCWMLHCQDVRDLVELTVDRMDVYHLVPFRNYWLLDAPQSAFIPYRHLHPASLARLLSCIATWILFDFSGFLGHVDSDCAALMTSDIRWERFSWNFALCSFVKAECRLGHAHKHTQIIF